MPGADARVTVYCQCLTELSSCLFHSQRLMFHVCLTNELSVTSVHSLEICQLPISVAHRQHLIMWTTHRLTVSADTLIIVMMTVILSPSQS